MNHRVSVAALALGVALSIAFASACGGDDLPQEPCRDIPDGGCPAYDNACEDPTCFVLYDCAPDNTWQIDQICPTKEAGLAIDAAENADDAATDALDTHDSALENIPGALGGAGCADLELPDCALGVAAACTSGCCGCEDLYVCNSGGWDLWGECDNGSITQN